mmetsp:Transcript_124389/g.285052  ORF Transcript_124389/g.285052 Transcript_124389/m.285052 type:complete len:427 (-) Transcript_124389:38-1318(-)|eukprot:CAMPEP_0204343358 /NCGR_PEP_ID=MMETSP0469-20131031/24842_1 /ASSEMBLY_ACC=CAM_ASM_000384 /TAXON_ID=2969 /ORGANISM="Oxyrrhis marina" /LENGTH=426 /DNA_ID=CAMNT_0051328439 /DNA_START=28 /DNA_END=1308 /DNA_ORIENTATION=+
MATDSNGNLVHSRCVQLRLSSLNQAISIFGSAGSAGTDTPLVLIPQARSNPFFISVPSGVTCLLQRCGKNLKAAEPGMQFLPLWYSISHVVTKQSCTYNAPVKTCPTGDNVMVDVDVTLVFLIANAEDFVYKLGASRFDEMLTGCVEEGIRLLVRGRTHNDVYTLRGNAAGNMLDTLNKKFDETGVQFTRCIVTDVKLPRDLRESLETTTKIKKKLELEVKEFEFKIAEQKRASEQEVTRVNRQTEQMKVQEEGKKWMEEKSMQQKLIVANNNKDLAMIESQGKTEVMIREATASLKRAKAEAESTKVKKVMEMQAEAQAKRITAQQEMKMIVAEAKGEQTKGEKEAAAIKVQAQAEAASATTLAEKRVYELEMREKQILTELARDGRFNLIGKKGDYVVQALLQGSTGTVGKASTGGGNAGCAQQ